MNHLIFDKHFQTDEVLPDKNNRLKSGVSLLLWKILCEQAKLFDK
jgi:hypothetical protein